MAILAAIGGLIVAGLIGIGLATAILFLNSKASKRAKK